MPITYSCDNCGCMVERSMDITVSEPRRLLVLCEDCWGKAKETLPKIKEMANADQN